MANKWQYKVCVESPALTEAEITESLNKSEDEGWELVAVQAPQPLPPGGDSANSRSASEAAKTQYSYMYIFKRPG